MLFTIASFLFLFGIVVFVHELGHFAVGKLSRSNVSEFGFGYPPRLFSLGVWRGTEYTINALPVGGFVNMGEDDPTLPNSMASKPWYVRAAAFLAGPVMNVVLAVLCYVAISIAGQQMPMGDVIIEDVAPGSPAEAAGLLVGDRMVVINGAEISNSLELSQATQLSAGMPIELTVERAGELLDVELVPRINPPAGEGAMGIGITMPDVRFETVRYPVGQAISMGFSRTWGMTQLIVSSFGAMFRGAIEADVTGPVGLAQITGQVARTGFVNLLDLMALVSVNLAILNLLPFPPLDGFRLLLIVIELVMGGRRLELRTTTVINAVGMVILLGLMFLVTVRDVIRVASGQSFLP
jgi:regulator of sigma E protease